MSAAPAFTRHVLTPHLSSIPGSTSAVREVSVSVTRDAGRLQLGYRLLGDLERLEFPPPGPADRTDGLWRHTCFELFVGSAAFSGYCEYNFSPSGAWAAYQFNGYRAGMRELDSVPPGIRTSLGPDEFELNVEVRGVAMQAGRLRLGVTAVIEDRAGVLSYWALKHPAEKPDFHLPDSFVLDL